MAIDTDRKRIANAYGSAVWRFISQKIEVLRERFLNIMLACEYNYRNSIAGN